MKKLFSFLFALIFSSVTFAQIEIDGSMLDWADISPLDSGPIEETVGDLAAYPDFDLKHLYITHDTANVYVRIDLNDAASFDNFWNYTNPPVFEFYMDTEIGDTTGFDWGWWNNAYNYYINLVADTSKEMKFAELYLYTGNRIPTWAPGEFVLLDSLALGINDERNAVEFAIPRDKVNFGTEFRPWVYSVADFQWTDGADQLPTEGGDYMLKYDFWYGGSVYPVHDPEIQTDIQIDGDILDWAALQPVDVDEIAEELGDQPTGPEFDLKDIYVTSDSTYFYMRIDIDPSATFSGIYTNYPNESAFQIMFDINWGDTTGLGYGGFWRLPVDYMIDLSAALNPDSTSNQVPLWRYVADWAGAFEEFAEVPGAFVTFAKNDEDNVVELSVKRSFLNAGTDIRPWVYVVGNENWDNEEYFPNPIWEGAPGTENGVYYCLNYNFISGASVHKMADKAAITSINGKTTPKITEGFGLVSNYPNPFNPSTKIHFSLPSSKVVSVAVYDILGRKIATLLNKKELAAGEHNLVWNGLDDNGKSMASGVYLYKIKSGGLTVTKKMMLLK